MAQLNAFVARSFDPKDEERIRPILEFLGTFRDAGFLCESADRAEVESVSKKVRDMIDERQVFVGFFTRRYPVHLFPSGIRGALKILFENPKPQTWSAPAWVLQESGYALRGGKNLILLKEPGVEVFGLQGDLEYVTFDPANPAGVQHKLSEMIHRLLAEAAGIEVRLVVSERADEAQVAKEPAQPEPEAKVPEGEPEEQTIIEHYFEMQRASASRDFGAMGEAWTAGTNLITQGEKWIDQLGWDCLYQEFRFDAGVAAGLETLRSLRGENAESAEPRLAMARCLGSSKEFEESAVLYIEASELQAGDARVRSLVEAAKAFREAKEFEKGAGAVELAIQVATGELREEAIRVKYMLLKDSGNDYLAFATAEAALHENPHLSLRFVLGLHYHQKNLTDLALFHFKFLHDRNAEDSSSLHNLALMCADSKLPITSVKHYRSAFSMGETLSAANLGYAYLDCGMAAEARSLVEQAMAMEDPAARVEKCLAEIIRRTQEEEVKESALLRTAETSKSLLVRMGRGLSRAPSPMHGTWKFGFGDMPLTISNGRLTGSAVVTTNQPRYGSPPFKLGTPQVTHTEKYTLDGTVIGAVCQFTLTVENLSEPGGLAALSLLLSGSSGRSGFILFEPDGVTAVYVELADGKLGTAETITRLG